MPKLTENGQRRRLRESPPTKPLQRIYIPILIAISSLAGCSGGAYVTISNNSRAKLENLVLSGSGFSKALGSLEPGAKRDIRIQPEGESSLRVTFTANGASFDSKPAGYFEGGGYRVDAEVKPDFEVEVTSTLESY